MSQPAPTRRRPGAAAAAATTTGPPPPEADADSNSDAHLYSQYASSPPASPQRQPPPPPTSRRPDIQQHDVAAQSHDWRPDHTLPHESQSFHDLHAAGRHSPQPNKPLLPLPSTLGPGPRSVLARAHPGSSICASHCASGPRIHCILYCTSSTQHPAVLLPLSLSSLCCAIFLFAHLRTLRLALDASSHPPLWIRLRRSGSRRVPPF